ncbi:MAG TPA: Ger(x)C family spore germination protein [Clostridia bacterium]|jgi:spore germination protein KC|nr:Ger(x)C family spore germination protein [Clostridia bacterium]
MKQKIVFLMLLAAALVFLTACWSSHETDELGYIILLGIDKGERNIVNVTFQLAIPQPIEGGDAEKASEVISVEAPSLFAALELADSFISKHLTFIHNKAIIVSEEIAREGLDRYINPLVRSREVRRTNFLMVTQGKASELIQANKTLVFERYPSRQIDIFMAASRTTGLLPHADIHRFYEGLNSPGSQPIAALIGMEKKSPEKEKEDELKQQEQNSKEKVEQGLAYLPGEIPRKGGNEIEIIGLAAFREDKLIGYLNGKETRFYQLLTGNFVRGSVTFPDPDPKEAGSNIIVAEIIQGRKPEVTIDLRQQKMKIRLFLEGEILSIQSGENYEQGRLRRQLEDYVSRTISREATRLIRKTQEEFRADIFGFGENTRTDFLTWQDWIEYDWLSKYPQFEVSVETEFHVRRTGMMMRTAPSEQKEG